MALYNRPSWISNADPREIITCFVLNKLTGDTIIFPSYPLDMGESYSASYNSSDVMGRSAPYFVYSGNEARTVSFTVKLNDNICPNMMNIINRLKALVYPIYRGSVVKSPHCFVKFGEMVEMNAIVTGVDVSWSDVVLDGNQHLSSAEVSLAFYETRLRSLPQANNMAKFNEGLVS